MKRVLVSLTVLVCLTVFSSSGTCPSLYGNAGPLPSYPPASPPEKRTIKSIAPGPKIIWDSEFGKAYRVCWSTAPTGPWEPLGGTLRGTGEEMWAYDDRSGGRMSFYRLEITDVTPPGMVAIPGGTYEMGDHFGLDAVYSLPVHTVRVDPFYMDATEVTNADYSRFLNAAWQAAETVIRKGAVCGAQDSAPAYLPLRTWEYGIGSDVLYDEFWDRFDVVFAREWHPVVSITWEGAAAYCNWRSEEDGLERCYDPDTWECNFQADGYRLPTEAEWEYAARGGLRYTMYPWGNDIHRNNANYNDSGDLHDNDWFVAIGHPTTPVAYYAPNPYGLYDMAGNVMERCHDSFREDYYQYCVDNGIADNPTGPPPGHEGRHVYRGGSCWSDPAELSCGLHNPRGSNAHGFRCVRRPTTP